MPGEPGQGVERLSFYLLKRVNKAIREFDMIRHGDRIAVAVSGGKDSLALLHLLTLRRNNTAIPFSLAAVHVAGDGTGVLPVHEPLRAWLAAHDVPFRIVEPGLGPGETLPLDCQRCTWLRRKTLFTTAEEQGCNVVAYAHHADDAAQTTLLNLLYNANPHTLAPAADYFDGTFRLIRPLFYVPESELARLARTAGFPAPPPACPRGDVSRRRLVSDMLKLMGRDYLVHGRNNLMSAGLRQQRTSHA